MTDRFVRDPVQPPERERETTKPTDNVECKLFSASDEENLFSK